MSNRSSVFQLVKLSALSIALVAVIQPIRGATAQDSNLSIATILVSDCLAPLVEELDSFGYNFETDMGSLETGVVDRWIAAGKTTKKLRESQPENVAAYITFEVQHMSVEYESLKKKKLQRTVSVRVSGLSFQDDVASRSVVSCPGNYSDVIDRRDVLRIEDSSIPETVGVVPSRGFIRRYGQPIIVGAASAVTVYLLFSVRSNEAGS